MYNSFLIILLSFLTSLSYSQNIESNSFEVSDSIKNKIVNELQARISNNRNWEVSESGDTIKILYLSQDGIYSFGCCPNEIKLPKEKKLLKWLRKDYLKSLEPLTYFYSDTFLINITFSSKWSDSKIDSRFIK